MSKFSSILAYTVKKLWTLIAIVLVLFALLMSLLRYSLPLLNDQKDHVEDYISSKYAIDLSVDELSASWSTAGPSLVLRGVNIAKGEQSPIALYVSELYLQIDFWPSISSMTLQSKQVVLNKLKLDIELNQIENTDSEYPIIQALETIFLEQLSNFAVNNSVITINSLLNTKSFNIQTLSWLNQGNRHQGVGEFAIDDLLNNHATFILDLYGDAESYSGTLYAQATDIDLSVWINEYSKLEGKLTASKGNAEVWAIINNGEISRFDGEIKPSSFDWDNNNYRLKNEISGKFAAIKREQRWDFSLVDIQLNTDNEGVSFALDGTFDDNNRLYLSTRNATSLTSLFPTLGIVSVDLADTLALIDTSATLQYLDISIRSDDIHIDGLINDIDWQSDNHTPGVYNLATNVVWHNTNGKIVVTGADAGVLSQKLFDRNLSLKSLNIPIFVDIGNETLSVESAKLGIDDLDLSFDIDVNLRTEFLSLLVDIEAIKLNEVSKWLPNYFMGKDAKSFLTRAFAGGGDITRGSVLWHGNINKFPFDDTLDNGIFQSVVNIESADFVFSNGWPALTSLDIDLYFENLALSMSSPSSKLGSVSLTNLEANIPNLTKNGVLTISARGDGQSHDLTDLMLNSTLSTTLGKLLANDVVVAGPLYTDLSLYIPLNDGKQTRAVGKVFLSNNDVDLPTLDLKFEQANGVIAFDNEAISITGLQANLFTQAVNVNIVGNKDEEQYRLDINMAGEWQTDLLPPYIGDRFATYFTGSTPWSIDVDVALQSKGFSYGALLTSDLLGLGSTLPAPFYKDENTVRSLLLAAKGDQTASSIDLHIIDVARFDGALAHKEKQFNRAHLAVGPTEFESRGVGFSISADFEEMYFDKWYSVIDALTASIGDAKTSILGLPQRIFVDTDKLILLDETFTDVDLTAKRLGDRWGLDIDADQMRGEVTIHDEWFSKGVNVDAEYVKIAKKSQSSQNPESNNTRLTATRKKVNIDPKTLPSINLTCKSCVIYGYDLGRVEIEAEPNDDGLKLNQIFMDNSAGSVNSSGQWYKRNQDHFTFIAGDLFSRDIGEFLEQLGFDSGIQDSSANMTFALTWKDSPFDVAFENLDGQVDWRLSDGYLAEVSDKGSRIFTLLSLNSLVRKLSLDFRDVFAKGFFYDNMQGSLQITEGKADTRDTNIDGAAGEIEIYGYTDLVSKELNYNVSFAPNVTGNLPVLVYFFTVSPPSALAALALDQVLSSTKVISNVNYAVTGTIDKPVLTETGRESTEVELPARRLIEQAPTDDEFVPPTKDDLLKIEVGDGQSD
ncbi:MAG: YhdP family protein [Glaciecola sp.]